MNDSSTVETKPPVVTTPETPMTIDDLRTTPAPDKMSWLSKIKATFGNARDLLKRFAKKPEVLTKEKTEALHQEFTEQHKKDAKDAADRLTLSLTEIMTPSKPDESQSRDPETIKQLVLNQFGGDKQRTLDWANAITAKTALGEQPEGYWTARQIQDLFPEDNLAVSPVSEVATTTGAEQITSPPSVEHPAEPATSTEPETQTAAETPQADDVQEARTLEEQKELEKKLGETLARHKKNLTALEDVKHLTDLPPNATLDTQTKIHVQTLKNNVDNSRKELEEVFNTLGFDKSMELLTQRVDSLDIEPGKKQEMHRRLESAKHITGTFMEVFAEALLHEITQELKKAQNEAAQAEKARPQH